MLVSIDLKAMPEVIDLTIIVEGADPDIGQINISLFNSEESYMKSPLAEQMLPVDVNGESQFNFPNLVPGTYAASVFYDKDSDGKLNTGFLGIPREKVGFSNNAKPKMGPAPYRDAKFDLTLTNHSIRINLNAAN